MGLSFEIIFNISVVFIRMKEKILKKKTNMQIGTTVFISHLTINIINTIKSPLNDHSSLNLRKKKKIFKIL